VPSVPCPHCGKPVLQGRPVCRWCKSTLSDKAPGPPRAPAPLPGGPLVDSLRAEWEELKAWEGGSFTPSPSVSKATWVSLVLAPLLFAIALASPKPMLEVRVPGFLGATVSVICLIAFGVEDLRLRGARNLGDPEATMRLFDIRTRGKDFKAAATALAQHPRAVARHSNLAEHWSGYALWGPLERRTASFRHRIVGIRDLADDLAVMTLEFRIRYGPWVLGLLFGVLGWLIYALVSEEEKIVIEKLLVLRQGRWYLVNGKPGDALDRQLLRTRSTMSGSGSP